MQVCHDLFLGRLTLRCMRGGRERRRQRILFPRHAQHRTLSVFIEMPLFPLRRDWVNICFLQAIDGPRGRRIKTDINCYRQCIPNNTCIFLVQAFAHMFLRPPDHHTATPTQNPSRSVYVVCGADWEAHAERKYPVQATTFLIMLLQPLQFFVH